VVVKSVFESGALGAEGSSDCSCGDAVGAGFECYALVLSVFCVS